MPEPAEKPCHVCGEPTRDRSGTVGWRKYTPRCADFEACRRRRNQRRKRPRKDEPV